jgi:ElaB/YqjD/DUF883 family membrane-anchored ribosome-binding protein
MSTHKSSAPSDLGALAEEASALLSATADVAGQKVQKAQERVGNALAAVKAGTQDVYSEVRKQADAYVRGKPYLTVGLAVGVGIFLGLLLARCQRGED